MALPTGSLLTVKPIAEYFRQTPNALYVQRHKGQAPGALAFKVGKSLRWDPDVVNAWVRSQQPNVDSESGE